jgi:hypothetical protein
MCAVCKKPVEQFWVQEFGFTGERIYIAICHGKQDDCELTEEQMFMISNGAHHVVEFVAFREKKEIGE